MPVQGNAIQYLYKYYKKDITVNSKANIISSCVVLPVHVGTWPLQQVVTVANIYLYRLGSDSVLNKMAESTYSRYIRLVF
jgi:hypothetical protein